jgi:ABC-type nickel/cobalt efflux system permease component RcnA
VGIIALALATALGVGAVHALEPGHGKALVAAYLVGARGTARHAVFLGLVVTASHTAGVFLLGLITLYASRYVVPERLYPWLGAISGLTIAGLGFWLLVQRVARGAGGDHRHHHHDVHHHHHGAGGPHHDHHHDEHGHGGRGHHHHDAPARLRELFALGLTGGIVPCPAALVVLLSAIALRRTGLGLMLIVAFSVGLAAVLVGIGLLMVYARRFMARVQGDGPVIRRWLPLASAAIIMVLGAGIAVQALLAAGIVQIRL